MPLLDINPLLVPDQAVWAVCALFHLADCVKVSCARELFLAETLGALWCPVFPFQILGDGRGVSLANPFLPMTGLVRMPWLAPGGGGSVRRLRLISRRLMPYRLLSTVFAAILFVAGPMLTNVYGLSTAVVTLAPLHAGTLVALGCALALDRQFWRLTPLRAAALFLECAVCPGYAPNIGRRLSLRLGTLPGDAVATAIAAAQCRSAGARHALRHDLRELVTASDLTEDEARIAAAQLALLDDAETEP